MKEAGDYITLVLDERLALRKILPREDLYTTHATNKVQVACPTRNIAISLVQ